MKRFSVVISVCALVALLAAGGWVVYRSSAPKQPVETVTAVIGDVTQEIVAAGTLEPKEEIEIKPQISGVLSTLVVQPGDKVKKDQLLGTVQLVPDIVAINRAEADLETAKLQAREAQRRVERGRELVREKALTTPEFEHLTTEHDLARSNVAAKTREVQLLRSGSSGEHSFRANQIVSTVEGVVLLLPEKVGSRVSAPNGFNIGTTVAIIADLSDMVFRGTVDELDVDRVKSGMQTKITVAALPDLTLFGNVVHVAARREQSPTEAGATQAARFAIEASLDSTNKAFVRSGYSANAHIAVASRSGVLVLNEAFIQFDGQGDAWVDVEVAKQQYQRRALQLGISDGISVEVLAGLTPGSIIRKPRMMP